MWTPNLKTRIDRRILLRYAIDPDLAATLLPKGLTPDIINGKAIGGICFIRIANLRPNGIPAALGIQAENAANQMSIRYTDKTGAQHAGAYIPERYTESRTAQLAGGRVFPGKQHGAHFNITEHATGYNVSFTSKTENVHADTEMVDNWASEIFPTPQAASDYYRDASVGFSPGREEEDYDAIELTMPTWKAAPLHVRDIHSTFYDSLPKGSIKFDHALIMRDLESHWRKPATV